jgi:hypothetical protein
MPTRKLTKTNILKLARGENVEDKRKRRGSLKTHDAGKVHYDIIQNKNLTRGRGQI